MDEVHGHPKDKYANPDAPEDVLPLSPLDSEEKTELETSESTENTNKSKSVVKQNISLAYVASVRVIKGLAGWIRHNSGLHDWLMVAFTGILTYVAIQQYVFNQQSAKSSGDQIGKIIDAADRIEDAADSFSGSASHINDGMSSAVSKLQSQTEKMEAARKSSEGEFALQRRPYLWQTSAVDSNRGNTDYSGGGDVGTPILRAGFHIENFGQSPASVTRVAGDVEVGGRDDDFNRLFGRLSAHDWKSYTSVMPPGRIDIFYVSSKETMQHGMTLNPAGSAAFLMRIQYVDTEGKLYESDICQYVTGLSKLGDYCPARLNLTKLIDCQKERCEN